MLENLIGCQIVRFEDYEIILKKNGIEHELKINVDSGDCCGYAEFKTLVYYNENDSRNPIITNVELVKDYDEYDSNKVKLVLYGENKELSAIDTEAGSGSGWHYGACVTLTCETLNIEQELANY